MIWFMDFRFFLFRGKFSNKFIFDRYENRTQRRRTFCDREKKTNLKSLKVDKNFLREKKLFSYRVIRQASKNFLILDSVET